MRRLRPAPLCRSWLFLEGANEAVLRAAPSSGADVLIQELEDFTPPHLRQTARALVPELYPTWREAGVIVAVRVNPLDGDGMDDLAAVMRGRPDIVALPKVAEPSHVAGRRLRLLCRRALCRRLRAIKKGNAPHRNHCTLIGSQL